MNPIKKAKLKNTFINQLPADSESINRTRQVTEACYSFVNPTIPKSPTLIHVSDAVVKLLELEDTEKQDFLNVVSGADNITGMKPYAMCYGGHQFGNWAGQLGDGRAINIGEIETEQAKWTLQLKGAGRTPYSRGADGLAVLRSSIREYLMSEAMYYLGVPTTRALSLSLTGVDVLRDVLYNGNAAYEKGAVVCRVAASFIRFGSFEIFAARGDHANLKKLVDYTLNEFYAELGEPNKQSYVAFFQEVVNRSLEMVVEWQRVGFVHGVMNTDNMSILGLTIDYGPYGWLENYDPAWTPNTTDAQHKRYRFGNQPSIVLWNLTQLANALYPLIEDATELEKILGKFRSDFQEKYKKMMLAKIGVSNELSDDSNLINQLTENLYHSQVDMTIFFRNLGHFDTENRNAHLSSIKEASYLTEELFEGQVFKWKIWLTEYSARLKQEDKTPDKRKAEMNAVNPKYVLRNYMAHLAIESAENGDYSILNELFELLKKPYNDQPSKDKWFSKRPSWADEKIGCSMLSCSS